MLLRAGAIVPENNMELLQIHCLHLQVLPPSRCPSARLYIFLLLHAQEITVP